MMTVGTWSDAKKALRYWLSRDPAPRVFSRDAWLILAITLVWFAAALALNGDAPSFGASGDRQGWNLWWDQGQYLVQTKQLARGEIKPNVYWIGYPALGAPFYRLLPTEPYLIPDLAVILAMVAVFYAASRALMSRLEAALMVYVFIWFDSFLRDQCLIPPFNTKPAYAAFFVCLYFFVFRREPLRMAHFMGCALLCGLAILARPTEAVALGILSTAGLSRLDGWKQRGIAAAMFGIIAGGMVAILLGLNLHLYHALRSPYMVLESAKINAANYGLKAWQFFYDATFLTGGGAIAVDPKPPSLFSRYPEFLLMLPGLLLLGRRYGGAAVLGLGAILSALGFYLLYIPFVDPPYAWSYSQLHYVAWMFPWLGLATYAGLRSGWKEMPRWQFAAALLLPLALAVVLGFGAVRVAYGTKLVSNRMTVTATRERGIYTVVLQSQAACQAEDVRLKFSRLPFFNGTEAKTVSLVQVLVNQQEKSQMVDYMTSQDRDTFHISFLAHGLALSPGDRMAIRLSSGRDEPVLASAELVDVRYAPMQALRDYFQP